MADEKIFTIPLRKAFLKPRQKRAKKAMTIIREYLQRHMKCEDVKIGKSINENVWERSIQHPPRRVRVHAIMQGDTVYAELVGTEIKKLTAEQTKKKETKKAEKKEKIKERRIERKKETIQDEIKEESGKKESEKPVAREEED